VSAVDGVLWRRLSRGDLNSFSRHAVEISATWSWLMIVDDDV
jgi:hypothetical protein